MFNNTRTGRLLFIAFGIIVVAVLLKSGFQLNRIRAIGDLTTRLYEHPYTVSNAVRSAQTAMIRMHRSMKDVALAQSPEEIDAAVKAVDEQEQIVYDRLEQARAQFLGDPQEFDAVVDAFANWKPIRSKVIALMREGKREEAAVITKGESANYVAGLEEKIRALRVFADGKAEEFLNDAQAVNNQAFLWSAILVIAVISIIIWIAAYAIRSVTRSAGEIQAGANILAASSGQILSAIIQVASGAIETAAAVSQTTTTVEEVKQAADVASQKAKRVSEGAQKAVQVSQSGEKAVNDTLERMHHIREQMASIADGIVRLSEQSQAIGEIIATVNDLADQSNLLAVNAAIEAAKAGEQGKGFAVVAEEIKSLAEQSKQATANVRVILSDIQRAISAAVMATEQGSKAVEAGVEQSAETGEVIRVLAANIEESAQAATLIATSARQQLAGMDQIALAMDSISQASSQTATSTQQAETAARDLNALGQKLKELVEQY